MVIEITPPQAQLHLEVSLSPGRPPTEIWTEPGAQGAGVTGIHGRGVSTPNAAEVAAATVGFESEVHIPKGKMLTNALWSMMVAAGMPPIMLGLDGRTINVPGAKPKVH